MAPAPEPVAAPAPAPGGDQLALLLHALQQRQIAPLPGAPAYAMPSLPVAAPVPAPAAQPDALGLLRMILGNPQFQQAMQLSPVTGYAPRSLELPVPAAPPPAAMRRVPIPLGAIMNTISALAAQSMTDLNATTREDEPEVPAYLVGDDGDFIVDPADADQRAALVAHLFRLSDEAQRSGWYPQAEAEAEDEAEDEYQLEAEMDESEEWARQAGFTW